MADKPTPPAADPAAVDDDFERRDGELGREIDDLENRTRDKTPKPPGVGAMF